MYCSKYNFFVEIDDKAMIVFNTLNNEYAIINKEAKERYFSKEHVDSDGLDPQVIDAFLNAGFFVYDPDAELITARDLYFSKCYDSSVFNATIIPTNECNLNCGYCFVNRSNSYMSPSTVKATSAYLKNVICLNRQSLSHFRVKWFGGEPLLRPSIIDTLSQDLIHVCADNGIDYRAMIYSNLTNVSNEVIDVIRRGQIYEINTTLDGYKSENDNRRLSKNGKCYFDTIISNILRLREDVRINIQVNVDQTNLYKVQQLVEFLVKDNIVDGNRVTIGFSLVNDNDNILDKSSLLSFDNKEFGKVIDHLYCILGDRARLSLPSPILQCFAAAKNSVVIDSEGYLYKCYRESKSNIAFGRVDEPSYTYSKYQFLFSQIDPLSRIECNECNIFPICFGGCFNQVNSLLICSKKYMLAQKIKRYFAGRTVDEWIAQEANHGQ